MKQKGILLKVNYSNNIAWNFETKEGNLKYRVDKEKKFNIFCTKKISIKFNIKCYWRNDKLTELFYSNVYKIIEIENKNGDRFLLLSNFWHQLIGQKTLDKQYYN